MVESKTKKIYIALTQTGTILSRIVKIVTRDKYNHVSISTSEDLSDLYSFGRINPYNPFKAGFVKETPTTGTFARFYKTDALVLELPVTEETYAGIKAELEDMYERREQYHYNYKGLFLAYFGKVKPKKNTYYCSEFAQSILKKYGLGLKKTEAELVCPNDFVNVHGGHIIYIGKFKDYNEHLLLKQGETEEKKEKI